MLPSLVFQSVRAGVMRKSKSQACVGETVQKQEKLSLDQIFLLCSHTEGGEDVFPSYTTSCVRGGGVICLWFEAPPCKPLIPLLTLLTSPPPLLNSTVNEPLEVGLKLKEE